MDRGKIGTRSGPTDKNGQGRCVKDDGRENAVASFPDNAVGKAEGECGKYGFRKGVSTKGTVENMRKEYEAGDKHRV